MVKNPHANPGDARDVGSIPGVGKILWRMKRRPTPVFFPGASHEQRSLEGYNPWGTHAEVVGLCRKRVKPLPWWSVVKNLPSDAGRSTSIPVQGTEISHARGLLSLWATTPEPVLSSPGPQLERSPHAAIETLVVFVGSPSRVRLSATPWTVAPQPPLSMGFSRQEYWSGLPGPPPGDLPDPGIEPSSPALAGGFFTTEPPHRMLPNEYYVGPPAKKIKKTEKTKFGSLM